VYSGFFAMERIMEYTINGKEYTKFDINKRCAELMGIDCSGIREGMHYMHGIPFNYCDNAQYAWPIIEKCWDELMTCYNYDYSPEWGNIIDDHNCTKLVAACICFIEISEAKK
jgi:hypothetical protein